jgi:serine/threonine protein kinase
VDSAPAARLDLTFRPETLVANRYLLVKKVGVGGMGSVWAAHDQALDAPCAVKLVNENLIANEEVRVRFAREAKLAAQLRSPHVVHVFDCGEANNTLYIVMEWLDGESLAQRLEREGKLDGATTYRVVAHVARALTTAHALGIVHRDLKPDNIFLVPGYDEETAKVLDFGIAYDSVYAHRDHLTIPGSLLGTPLYLSPEQARGKPVDHRADLWSLGVIVFECLTGSSPFDAPAIGEIMGRILYEPLPRPSELNEELSPEIDAWWLRAASRKKEERFDSAKELVDALAAALSLERSVSVPPPGRSRASSIPGLTRASGIQLPKSGDRGSEPPSTRPGDRQSAPSPPRDESATVSPPSEVSAVPDELESTDSSATGQPAEEEAKAARTKLLWPSDASSEAESGPDASDSAVVGKLDAATISPAEAELDGSVPSSSPAEESAEQNFPLAAASRSEGSEPVPEGPGLDDFLTAETDLVDETSPRPRVQLAVLAGITILMFLTGVVLVLAMSATSADPESVAPPPEAAAVESPPEAPESESLQPELAPEPDSDMPVIRLENLPKAPNQVPKSSPAARPARPAAPPPPAPASSVRDYGI